MTILAPAQPPVSPGNALLVSRALREDGNRVKMHPLESTGRFTRLQAWLYPALIAFYAALPWVKVGGHPAVWIDIEHRRFFLFGLTFNSTDFYLVFFLLSGAGFSLIVLSALFGRVWCGYACPQTVFMEGVFRRIEQWVEGPARKRQARDAGPWTAPRVVRVLVKHALFLLSGFGVAHIFLAYFASADSVLWMMQQSPLENLTPFLWAASITLVMCFNFAWFREQTCLVMCPYGRLQGALVDRDTITVGYDVLRGEPRGKKGKATGDCVDCTKCVQVCPTGIDIRLGSGQMECVGCGHCIDACDQVMDAIGKPRGLVRYDSINGLEKMPGRFLRGRLVGYGIAGLAGLVAMTTAVSLRKGFDAALLRGTSMPRERQGDKVVERFVAHVASKSADEHTFVLALEAPEGSELLLPMASLTMKPFESRHVPVVVTIPWENSGVGVLKLRVTETETGVTRESQLPL
jgi:cytochrome c oxidase accessory protein FixG